jgi:hypothetical protein
LLLAKPPAASHTQEQQVPAAAPGVVVVAAATTKTTVASSITSASRLSLYSFFSLANFCNDPTCSLGLAGFIFVLGTRFIIKTCLVVTDVDVAPSAVAAPPARE